MKYVFTTFFGIDTVDNSTNNDVIRKVTEAFQTKGFSVEKIHVKKTTSRTADVNLIVYIDTYEAKISNAWELVDAFPDFAFDTIKVIQKK